MNQDVFGEVLAALSVAQERGKLSGVYGVPPVKFRSGDLIVPQHLMLSFYPYTYTASLYVEVPIYIERVETFSGVKFHNSTTSNRGAKVKAAIYGETDAGGRSLAKNFGEVTLDATAALRTLASPWTPDKPGWYFLRSVADGAVNVYGMAASSRIANSPENWVGAFPPISFKFPRRETSLVGAPYNTFCGYSCAGAYGDFPEVVAPMERQQILGMEIPLYRIPLCQASFCTNRGVMPK